MPNTPLYIPSLVQRNKFTDYRYDVWGDSFNWYTTRTWETIKYLVIHHSVTNPSNNAKSDVDYIAQIHKNNGWGGIGYHFVITADGMVWYVGDISTQRANVADKNHLVIGICLVGDFTKGNPTDDQILSAHDLCQYLLSDVPALTNVNSWNDVVGHKELQSTQCPGTYWKGVGDSIYERIKNRIPYTPQPEPQPVIDWEKAYNELKETCQQAKEDAIKDAVITAKLEFDSKIAVQKAECQQEKDKLQQIIDNLKSENPKIPTIKDFSDKEVISESLSRIVNIILRKKTP